MSSVFLTPAVRALLDQVAAGPPADGSVEGQRVGLAGAMGALGWPPAGASAAILPLSGGAAVQIFMPANAGSASSRNASLPVIVYLHGGSFVAGDVATHAGLAKALAERAGAAVALIDYRRTPEHPLPAACDDAVAGVRAVMAAAASHGLDVTRLTLLGDSAGGWLAVQTAIALTRSDGRIARLVLVNPMITPRPERTGSRAEFATGYFATTADFDGGWALAGDWAMGNVHPDAAPDDVLALLPPTVIISNEADPVRDEAESFAEQLAGAGVAVMSLRARGLIHAAWLFPQALPEADLLLAVIAGAARL